MEINNNDIFLILVALDYLIDYCEEELQHESPVSHVYKGYLIKANELKNEIYDNL